MARQRRGGFRAPELRGTLGTLLRTTREVIERGAREGRSRLDDVLAGRRRHDAIAELGEIVLDLIRRGEIDPAELPEVREIVAHLDELDAGHAEHRDEPIDPPPVRRRFDERKSDGTVAAKAWSPPARSKAPAKVWRPPVEVAPQAAEPPRPRDPKRKGGITFDDDDLADYMHPDDVPPRDPDGEA